ncbi:MAG: hypothetical protein ACR2FN_00730 [Chitinophagaceae bacterium]
MGELLEIFYAALIIYFLYKLIFGLIVPVSKASSTVRTKMKQMQEEELRRQNTAKPSQAAKTKVSDQEYIDFEEIKE